MAKEVDFEEVELVCTICGKPVKQVIYSGYDTSDFVCPKCTSGDFGDDDDDVDI